MSTPYKDVDSNAIIADIRKVNDHYAKGRVTRDEYRLHGMFSDRKIKEKFGNFQNAVNAAIGNAKAKQEIVRHTPTETDEHVGDRWEISRNTGADIHTLEELVDFCNIDLSEWRVERWVCNKWAVGAKDSSKRIVVTPLFQVKATLVRREGMTAAKNEVESLKDEAKRVARVPKVIVYPFKRSGNLLELLLPDLHAGKLSYSKETSGADYDIAIAVDTYRRALDSLLTAASGYTFDRIVLGIGNDALQSDNIQGTTYSGTKVDTDTRFHKVYVTVRKMLCETIEKLRILAPVDVKIVPGNHDTLSAFTLGDSLECMFHNYPDVRVDNSPNKHKLLEWGDVLLAMIHGHEGKQADYGIWLASTYPQEFGRTKYREIHVGHRHKTALDEKFGVRVRTFSALCPPDAWHASNLFVNNLRTAEALVWNKDRGLIAQFYHTEVD